MGRHHVAQNMQAISAKQFGMNATNTTAVADATSAGLKIGFLRIWDGNGGGLHWAALAPTSARSYTWTNFDSAVSLAFAAGWDISFTCGYAPHWAAAGNTNNAFPSPNPASNNQDYFDFVTDVIARASGRVRYFEPWNEFNDASGYWNGGTTLMATYCSNWATQVSGLSGITVVMPSISTAGTNFPAALNVHNTLISNGGAASCACYNAHLYPLSTTIPGTGSPEAIYYYAYWLLALRSAAGQSNREWFVNEGGALDDFGATASQTRWAALWPLILTSLGAKHAWYGLEFGAGASNFDKLWNGSSLTTAGQAYKQINVAMVGARWINKVARVALTNSVTNPNATGAVNGTPGTAPTGWTVNALDSGHGVSTQIVGSGTEAGIGYVDWRVFGTVTAGAAGATQLFFNAAVTANTGEFWNWGAYLSAKATSGTQPAVTLQLQVAGTNPNWTVFLPVNAALPYGLNGFQGIMPASTVSIRPMLQLNYSVGDTFDITLRIGRPYADKGSIWQGDLAGPSAGNLTRIIWDATGGPTTYSTAGTPYTQQTDATNTKTAIVANQVSLTGQPLVLTSL